MFGFNLHVMPMTKFVSLTMWQILICPNHVNHLKCVVRLYFEKFVANHISKYSVEILRHCIVRGLSVRLRVVLILLLL